MIKKILAGAISAMIFAGAAHAQIAVSVWNNSAGATAAGANATLAQAATLGAPSATTTVSAINFNSAVGGYTIGGFLNNPAGLTPSVASADLNNTYFYLTGQVLLNAGNNAFVVAHDDGLQLNITGIGMVVNQPGPTSPVNTPFNVVAPFAGLYDFQMSYGETAGPPAQLIWQINGATVGGVPEPATWGMMLLGFAGIGVAMRRRRSNQALLQVA